MTRYINKADVVAEIERLKANIKEYCVREGHDRRFDVVPEQLAKILSFIDSLETKEVELEEEITSQIRLLSGVHTLYDGKQWWKGTYNELSYFAKYFFELGLNTQKGE